MGQTWFLISFVTWWYFIFVLKWYFSKDFIKNMIGRNKEKSIWDQRVRVCEVHLPSKLKRNLRARTLAEKVFAGKAWRNTIAHLLMFNSHLNETWLCIVQSSRRCMMVKELENALQTTCYSSPYVWPCLLKFKCNLIPIYYLHYNRGFYSWTSIFSTLKWITENSRHWRQTTAHVGSQWAIASA